MRRVRDGVDGLPDNPTTVSTLSSRRWLRIYQTIPAKASVTESAVCPRRPIKSEIRNNVANK
jgi:hypothetical protein